MMDGPSTEKLKWYLCWGENKKQPEDSKDNILNTFGRLT